MNVLEKVYKESQSDEKYECLADVLCENILTYEEMGELLVELLSYHGGKYDGEAMKLAERMMGEYIDLEL